MSSCLQVGFEHEHCQTVVIAGFIYLFFSPFWLETAVQNLLTPHGDER